MRGEGSGARKCGPDPDTTGVVVMTAKYIPPGAGGGPPALDTPDLDAYDQQLMTAVVDRGPGIHLVVLRRYRFDNLPGGILNIRGRAIGALRDQLTLDLRRQQTTGK